MRWIMFGVILSIFSGSTAGALVASASGWGLPGLLEKPVPVKMGNIRQGSHSHRRRHTGMFIYFGSRRRHHGGGYGYGK